MRCIPTTPARVDALKMQAKRLQRTGRGKHAELLDRVARGAGYEHCHRVVRCLKETLGEHAACSLRSEIEQIVASALRGAARLVVTGAEACASQPFILFSTQDGDAWLLDPVSDAALCLSWHRVRQKVHVVDRPATLEIRRDGNFGLSGPFFTVQTDHPEIRGRGIAGYPTEEIRAVLDDLQPVDQPIDAIFGRPDVVDLTEEVIAQLVLTGWEQEGVREAARNGAQYSRSRGKLLFPTMDSL